MLTVFLSDAVAVGHSVEEDPAAEVVAGERPGGPREVLRAAVGGAETICSYVTYWKHDIPLGNVFDQEHSLLLSFSQQFIRYCLLKM